MNPNANTSGLSVVSFRLNSDRRIAGSSANSPIFALQAPISNVIGYVPHCKSCFVFCFTVLFVVFTICNSWPNVNANNQTLTLSIAGVAGTTSIAITNGSYVSSTTFIASVQSQINALGGIYAGVTFSPPMGDTATTNSSLVSVGGASAVNFIWSSSSSAPFFGRRITSATDTTTFRTGMINMVDTPSIQLTSHQILPEHTIDSNSTMNCFLHAPFGQTPKYTYYIFQNEAPSNWVVRRFSQPKILTTIDIQLVDSNNVLLPINEGDPAWELGLFLVIAK